MLVLKNINMQQEIQHTHPWSPNAVSVILIADVNLKADPWRAVFSLKAVMCNLVVLTIQSGRPSFPCVRWWTQKSPVLWCLKFVSAQNENSFQGWGTMAIVSVLQATGRGRRGGGTQGRSSSRTCHPACGQEEGGREGFTRSPLPKAPCTSMPALPKLLQ